MSKRTLTITLEIEDAGLSEFEVIDYSMDVICGVYSDDEFVDAKLDEEVLVDRNGYISIKVPDEIKSRFVW